MEKPKVTYTSSTEEEQPPSKTRQRGSFGFGLGWRSAVYACAFACAVSFLVNVLLMIIMIANWGVDGNGRLKLYEGNCNTSKQLNTGIHIIINFMSTILLSSSNYVMQCLCAVTREEVDAAHMGKRRSKWAEIGVPSMSNMFLIDRRRVALWYLLMLSSVPLHLFYNSAVFSSTATYSTPIVSVNPKFMEDALDPTLQIQQPASFTDLSTNIETREFLVDGVYSQSNYTTAGIYRQTPQYTEGSAEYLFHRAEVLKEMSVPDCIDAYAQTYQTSLSGLVLVMDVSQIDINNANVTDPVVFDRSASQFSGLQCTQDRYAWICQQSRLNRCFNAGGVRFTRSCEEQLPDLVSANGSNWRPLLREYRVSKCYAEQVPEKCKLQASIHLIAAVIVLNAFKAAIMFLSVKWMRGDPLLTIGDAIASFLERPDPSTVNNCLLTRHEACRDIVRHGKLKDTPRAFEGKRPRWVSGVGLFRQILMAILLLSSIATIAYLYAFGLAEAKKDGAKTDPASLWGMGIGSVNPMTTISFDGESLGLVGSAFIANVPQLILSFIYFVYNGVLTTYFLGAEWQSYMRNRKGLRVSDTPRGEQRATYFLQLPYKAAMPLMVVSGLLHWLVSQSIFLVSIENYAFDRGVDWRAGEFPYTQDFETFEDGLTQLTCGYSLIPMIFVLVITVVLLLVLVGLGAVPFQTSMPVASSNSLAIAAACHLPADEFMEGGAALKRLQWGVVGEPTSDGVGHCCFSSREVAEPQKLNLYM